MRSSIVLGGPRHTARRLRRYQHVLDGARDLAELAVVHPERPAPLVPAVGREGKARPVRREARQRAHLARSELAVDLPVQSRVSISFPCSRNVAETPNAMRDPSAESATSLGRSSSITSSGVTSPAVMATASVLGDANGAGYILADDPGLRHRR
jgi:hypothetical protein